MNPKDRDEVVARYRERLEKFGLDIRSLASGTPERRLMRFKVLQSVGDLQGARLLDVGCGFGDFYQFLKDQGIQTQYTGYDISPELVKLSAERFPEAKFEVRDIEEKGVEGKFDFIVSSQTFNYKLAREDNFEMVKNVLKICYESAEKGVVCDFLTSYVDFQEPHLYYYSPEKVFGYAKSLTRQVMIRHDYPLFEFALFLYPTFKGWNG